MNPIRVHPGLTLALAAMLLVAAPGALSAASHPAKASSAHAPAHAVVPFIDDDLPRALAAAKKSDRPIFVESWAPW